MLNYVVITTINGDTDIEYFNTLKDAQEYAGNSGNIYKEVTK